MIVALLLSFWPEIGRPADVGEAAKPFDFETVDGGVVRLSDFQGKEAVLLTFISISCFECDEVGPVISKAIDEYQRSGILQVLFVAVANKRGAAWIAKTGKYDPRAPLLVEKVSGDALEAADSYGAVATPFMVLIGKEGRIEWKHLGRVDFETLEIAIRKVLQSTR